MVNEVTLVGNLGADPEVKATNSGMQVANLRVATTSRGKVNGEYQDITEWHRVTVFGKSAEFAGNYLQKGRQVYIRGRIQTRSWEDNDGNKRYSTEIIANELKGLGKRDSGGSDSGGYGKAASDDIPF